MRQAPPPTDASTLRPWQLFTLLALLCATAAVFVVRGTSPASIILICLGIGSAAFVGAGALRTLRPLVSTDQYEPEMVGGRTRAALEREKNLLLRAIKELEFDHAMGKIAAADYQDMVGRLRTRAVRLLRQLNTAESGYREIIERELATRLGKAGAITLDNEDAVRQTRAGECAACHTFSGPDARFCKQCGARLLLLLLAFLSLAGPSWAQLQMPDPKEMAGIPRPVTDLADGHISVRLIRGQLSNNIPNQPVELHAGTKVITVKTDENGRAEFSGVAAGTSVKAVAVVDGERLESQEFAAPGQNGIRLILVATPKASVAPPPVLQPQPGSVVLGDQTRIVLELADEALQVYYLLDIRNNARGPVNPTNAFILDMPTGAQGTAILEGGSQAIARGSRVTVTGPFAPGQTAVQVAFQLPYSGDKARVSQLLPVPIDGGVAVLMKKVGDMAIASPQLPAQQEREFDGVRYVLAQGPSLGTGSLMLNISGLPHHSPVPRGIALALVTVIFGIGLWAAVRVPPRTGGRARVTQLTAKRERIFGELVRLEQQRRTGRIDARAFSEGRAALVSELERVYRDLDAEGDQGRAA